MRTILRWVGISLLALGVVAAVIAVIVFGPSLGSSSKNNVANSDVRTESEIDPQCRVDGVLAYMLGQGFGDDDFVVGEERVDKTAPEFFSAGSLPFAVDDSIVNSRESLQALFDSQKPAYQLVQETQLKMLNQYDREVVLDARNWEIVQTTVDSTLSGNTGLLAGAVISAGDTFSEAGDAAWVFVDPATCTVPRATHDSMGNPVNASSAEADKPVGFIRVGCKNPGNGFVPIPPPPPVVVEPKDPSQDPSARENAGTGGGSNAVTGPGQYIAPEQMAQPPAEPRVNPALPAPPAPPAPPRPALTPDAAPPPPPQPLTPQPSAPETECVPIIGVEDCS